MRKVFLPNVKAAFPVLIAGFLFQLIFATSSSAQLHIVSQKDNTRPDQEIKPAQFAAFTSFTAIRNSGYNDVQWAAVQETNIRKYIVEYSTNGIDYQSAGEIFVGSPYQFKHHIAGNRSMLYRIKTEDLNGRFSYSSNFLLEGTDIAPVRIYPTIVTGNVVNANADWSVERVNIASLSGVQVFAKDINGQKDFIPLAIPSLAKGMYVVTFYGKDWQSSSKFLVP